ncbi:hypothetical protein cyc_02090, partial [Cyclospora cayetanensis]
MQEILACHRLLPTSRPCPSAFGCNARGKDLWVRGVAITMNERVTEHEASPRQGKRDETDTRRQPFPSLTPARRSLALVVE